MKKISTALFLLFSGLAIFLATVDLEPYLAKDTEEISPQNQVVTESTPEPAKDPEVIEVTKVADVPDQPASQVGLADQTKTTDLALEEMDVPPEADQIALADQESQAQAIVENRGPEPDQTQDPEITVEVRDVNPAEETPVIASPTPKPLQANEIISAELSRARTKLEQITTPLIELEVSVGDEGDYPYSVLLATFLRENTAQKAIPIYKRQNISAHWVKIDLGDDNVRYRLFTGAFSTKNQAQQYLEERQLTDGMVKTTRYSSRIGVYQETTELAEAFVKAKEIGLMPYILANRAEVYHLYVGAFYTYEGASNQCDKLLEVGMSCRPVSRSIE